MLVTEWVGQSLLGYDSEKQRDDEIYSGYIYEWVRRCDLDNWNAWNSWLLAGGQPRLLVDVDQQLFELCRWLLVRVWPGRYPTLEKALQNFAGVRADFRLVFHKHAERPTSTSIEFFTIKFYRIQEWDPEKYASLLRQYDHHVSLCRGPDAGVDQGRESGLRRDACDTVVSVSFAGGQALHAFPIRKFVRPRRRLAKARNGS